ncbi:hypothetical protein [Microbispora sp. H10949]|uniref:hypothetical protein n=1 Tax=Microbispora sp. H10949 TaxID=2729111 RepID=UPI001600A7E7|nr:hypothetical protein [Microbispora sp. H10949]
MSTHEEHRRPVAALAPGPSALPAEGPARPVTVPLAVTAHTSEGRRPAHEGEPPLRSKVAVALAVLACAACCALPVLIGAGLLTGAGAALAERTLLAVSGLLLAAAAGMWWLHRRTTTAAARSAGTGRGPSGTGCGPSGCACGG